MRLCYDTKIAEVGNDQTQQKVNKNEVKFERDFANALWKIFLWDFFTRSENFSSATTLWKSSWKKIQFFLKRNSG